MNHDHDAKNTRWIIMRTFYPRHPLWHYKQTPLAVLH